MKALSSGLVKGNEVGLYTGLIKNSSRHAPRYYCASCYGTIGIAIIDV